MRERRHLSGSSNSHAPVTARPLSALPSSGSSSNQSHETEEKRPQSRPRTGGFATARRPSTAAEERTERLARRRIHSARVESSSRTPDPSSSFQSLASTPSAAATTESSALPQLRSRPPSSATPRSIGQEVQWAVKVHDAPESDGAARSETAAAPASALREFSLLLRDRYEGKRSLRLAFLNWDRDKDGQLSVPEVRDLINSLGFAKRLGRDNVEDILRHIAARPTQSLNYDAFCSYVFGQSDARGNTPSSSSTTAATAATTASSNGAVPLQTANNTASTELLSSDRALYPDTDHVVNLLRKKYESRRLRNAFRHWDADKDGGINLSELDANLRRQGVRLAPPLLRELFDRFDLDRDGRLLYNEFVDMVYGPVAPEHHNPALLAHRRDAEQQEQRDAYRILRNAALENPMRRIDEDAICDVVREKIRVFAPRVHDAYAAFDDDHNGNLSYAEFRQGLSELGLHFTEREFLHLAAIVDTDGSGEISFREFNNLFQRPSARGERPDSAQHQLKDDQSGQSADLNRQRARLSNGTFDFSHLTRRTKIPTRRGRTPIHDTKDLITPEHTAATTTLHTEAQIYGSGQKTARGAAERHVLATLGQEEKQRKDARYASRLHRIREQQQAYDQRVEPLHDAYDQMQQRRSQTLHRHQQRYQHSIEEQRPRHQQVAQDASTGAAASRVAPVASPPPFVHSR
ncbi:hypothetical protein PINS_up010728 [Pythium insidiosum]|nr:hypothetical protein PINS_up010728 [Pythium insidiosum]